MGVEIETITPGDGKVAVKIRYVTWIICVIIDYSCRTQSCSSLCQTLYLQEGLSPKKDRRVWCIMLVSLNVQCAVEYAYAQCALHTHDQIQIVFRIDSYPQGRVQVA